MSNDVQRRISAFIELNADAKKKKINKSVKRIDKAKKNPTAFHDKLDAKLEKLAKKHGVSIKMRRNKTKMSTILVGKLKNKKYGEVVNLFKEISNTSPVPQKMLENGAAFRVFGPRKLAASDTLIDPHALMIAMEHDPALKAKWKKILAEGGDTATEDTSDDTSEDTSEDATDDTSEEDTGDDEDTSAEDDANKADIVKYITDNNISRDSLNTLLDKAVKVYVDDLKTNGPIDDTVDFMYNILGPDEVKTGLKALTNKQNITASNKKVLAKRKV